MAVFFVLLIDLIIFGGFAAWQIAGIEGTHNLYLFVTWGIAILTIVFIPFAKIEPPKKVSIFRRILVRTRQIFIILTSIWLGMTWLAIAWVFSALIVFVHNERCKKTIIDKSEGIV